MKKIVTTGLIIALAATLSTPASAGGKYFRHRLAAQEMRADQGVVSGELTRREARVVRGEHKVLTGLTHRKAHDGWLSPLDRVALEHRYDRASEWLYRLKHNDHSRYSG